MTDKARADSFARARSDVIAVNLMRLAGLTKEKARECEAIVRHVLAGLVDQPDEHTANALRLSSASPLAFEACRLLREAASQPQGRYVAPPEFAGAVRMAVEALENVAVIVEAPPCEPVPAQRYRVEHDGFVGTLVGTYCRLDGERGSVLQQDGTRVVHVYRDKWLLPVSDSP